MNTRQAQTQGPQPGLDPDLSIQNLAHHGLNLAISEWTFAAVLKRVFVRNHSFENEFHIQVLFRTNETYFLGFF